MRSRASRDRPADGSGPPAHPGKDRDGLGGRIDDPSDHDHEEHGHQDKDEGTSHPLIVDRDGPAAKPRERLNLARLILASAIAAAVTVGTVRVTIPVVTVEPGPTADAGSLVTISGAETFNPQGRHLVTTVLVTDHNTVASALWGWVVPEVDVLPRSAIYPPGSTQEDIDREVSDQMDDSQTSAKVAALRVLGHQVPLEGVLVRRILAGTPAAAQLKAGDVILEMNGAAIAGVQQWLMLLSDTQVGDSVDLTVRRQDERLQLSMEVVTLVGSPEPDLGFEGADAYAFPFDVKIDAGDIGGPSAGLTFSLAVAELLTPRDLTRGRIIADTGTIDVDGRIGKVGGVEQKVVAAKRKGADIFLIPRPNHAEANAAAGKSLEVIPVSTLQEAIQALMKKS